MQGTRRLRIAFATLTLITLTGGCVHSDLARSGVIKGRAWSERVAEQVSPVYIDQLKSELLALGPQVGEAEAALVAEAAVRHADRLRREWGMVRPVELNNVLVNLGVLKAGLCYQCAEAMYIRLRRLDLKTFDLRWGVAHKGDLWLEHSGVIVTARGRPFEQGLVLDAWRHSGRLRWARVADDRYPWVEMIKYKFMDRPPPVTDTAVADLEPRHVEGQREDEGGDAISAAASMRRTTRDAAGTASGSLAIPSGASSQGTERADGRVGAPAPVRAPARLPAG